MNNNPLPLGFLLYLIILCSCNDNSNTKTITENRPPLVLEVKATFINNDSLHYIDIGKGSPIIFVHGAGGDYRGFSTQLDTFSQNHRVIVYSRRYGYPDGGVITDSLHYSIDQHVKDLVEFIKVLNLAPVHLVGHSFGANICLQIALDHPELVSSITLGEPALSTLILNVPGGDTILKNFATKYKMPAAEAFKEGKNEEALKCFVSGVTGDTSYYSNIPPAGIERLKNNISELRAIAMTQNPFTSISCDQVRKMNVPVLLVVGDLSPAMFKITANELDRCLPKKERAILHNTSHGLQDQNPTEFNKLVLAFIDRH
jgi:pimeloyl-ACP methyl ester carboxylesterase